MPSNAVDFDAIRCSHGEAIGLVRDLSEEFRAEEAAASFLTDALAHLLEDSRPATGWRGAVARLLMSAGWAAFHEPGFEHVRVRLFEAAVAVSPRNTDGWRGLSVCHDANGHSIAALEAAETVLASSPGDASALLTSASSALAVGRLDLAMRRSQAALESDPSDGSAHRIRAWVAAFLDQWQVAVDHFSTAIEIDQTDAEARWGRASNLPRVGRNGDAEGDLSFLASMRSDASPEDSRHRLKIRALWALGRHQDTAEFMDRLVAQPAAATPDTIDLLRSYLEAKHQIADLVSYADSVVTLHDEDLSSVPIRLRLALAEIFVLVDRHVLVELLLESVSNDLPPASDSADSPLPVADAEKLALLLSWAAAAQNRFGEANVLYEGAIYPTTRRNYRALSQCHVDELTEIRGPRPGIVSGRDIVAFTRVRNERERLVPFLDHYRALGVRWFFFVDNGSDDGTVEFLLRHRDVFVYSATNHFRETDGGLTWTQHLANSFALGNWTLHVDADELLLFPHHLDVGLPGLTRYMADQGFHYLAAPMLLMHPDPAATDSAADMRVRYSMFDPAMELTGCLEAPYVDAVSSSGLFDVDPHMVASPELMKIPVVRQSLQHHHVNLHRVRPGSVCDASGVLLHYKFATDLPSRSTYAYASKLWNSTLVDERSEHDERLEQLVDFGQLVEAGVVRESEMFDKFVEDGGQRP